MLARRGGSILQPPHSIFLTDSPKPMLRISQTPFLFSCVLSSCVLSSCVHSSCVLSSCVLSSCVLSSCVLSSCVLSSRVLSSCVQWTMLEGSLAMERVRCSLNEGFPPLPCPGKGWLCRGGRGRPMDGASSVRSRTKE